MAKVGKQFSGKKKKKKKEVIDISQQERERKAKFKVSPITTRKTTKEDIERVEEQRKPREEEPKKRTLKEMGRQIITGGEEFERLRKEGRLHAGTVPIAPTGAVVGVAEKGAEMIKTYKAMKTAKAAKRQAESVQRISSAFKLKEGYVSKIIEKQLLQKEINTIIKGTDVTTLAKKSTGLLLKVGGTVAGIDAMFQWYALDNVIGGQKFFMKDVLKELRAGKISHTQAMEALEESREIREIAINKVIQSNSINPLLWAVRKLILAGVEGDTMAIELMEEQIEGVELPEEETESL